MRVSCTKFIALLAHLFDPQMAPSPIPYNQELHQRMYIGEEMRSFGATAVGPPRPIYYRRFFGPLEGLPAEYFGLRRADSQSAPQFAPPSRRLLVEK